MEYRNFLLAALRPEDAAVLTPRLKEVTLTVGQVLAEPDDVVETLYFPSSSCLSVVAVMSDGKAIETTTVGRETATPLLDVLTQRRAALRTFVQVAGSAIVIPAATFRARLDESPALRRLVLLHVRATARQLETSVACNLAHTADGRLARWLLMTQDRVGADVFPLTQDYMAIMTGVQRSTVSLLAGALKRDAVIDYVRGSVRVVDRDQLIARACECYSTVESEFESLRDNRE